MTPTAPLASLPVHWTVFDIVAIAGKDSRNSRAS